MSSHERLICHRISSEWLLLLGFLGVETQHYLVTRLPRLHLPCFWGSHSDSNAILVDAAAETRLCMIA
jgi:hypothetical protein